MIKWAQASYSTKILYIIPLSLNARQKPIGLVQGAAGKERHWCLCSAQDRWVPKWIPLPLWWTRGLSFRVYWLKWYCSGFTDRGIAMDWRSVFLASWELIAWRMEAQENDWGREKMVWTLDWLSSGHQNWNWWPITPREHSPRSEEAIPIKRFCN